MEFIDRVLLLLKQSGVTESKMLRDLQMPKNSFADWSRRGGVPDRITLSRIADYFGVTVDRLLRKESDPAADVSHAELQNIWHRLSESEREQLLTYARFLKAEKDAGSPKKD